jgi:5'(3')-deoxyribonucleotidase
VEVCKIKSNQLYFGNYLNMEKGKRYNVGKLRIDLLPIGPLKKIVEVYTNGAHKYTVYQDSQGNKHLGKDTPVSEVIKQKMTIVEDGSDNWRKGMSWKETAACSQRHILAFLEGEDIDPDPMMMTYHLANAAWNLIAILEYYETHPEFDDRNQKYLNVPKIGLDIDEVLADWVGSWIKLHGLPTPTSWFFDRDIVAKFEKMKKAKTLDKFYLSLKPKVKPEDIPFESHCYVTSRPVDTAITEQWLHNHGFPAKPVITVPLGTSKVEVMKQAGVEVFVDDRYDNFLELNKAGITTFLFDAPHNQRYKVGYKRIKSLSELPWFK